ncbi:P22 phage major capsid protein family protein [Lysobacter capsici]|uniref:P22 phage major capsid protein family protein n=1 Tax=Lysobacter capsici TaxID=435897 RepID=UPI001C00901F|nr:P22 phage major capsid protein family protein [Lysobacter capsici]QWF19295.1 hypothetical protein KME82_11420 [Lysobacter capsici]
MANTFSTQQIFAAEVAAIIEESCPFLMGINRAREKEFAKAPNGFKIGNSVKVMIPGIGPVYDGVVLAGGGAVADWQEKQVDLSIDTQKHTAVNVTADEAVFKLDATDPRRKDYRERVMKPQMSSLCATIEADLIRRAVLATPNLVGTPGTVPSTMKIFTQARGKLQKALAPASPRDQLISTDVNAELIDSSKQLFNPQADISKMYRESYIGRANQADWHECVNLPTLTNGNKVTGVTVSGASQTGTSLLVGGLAAADTFKKGQIFTIAGVYQTHPLTGDIYPDLQQFVVTADVTSAGTTVSIPIYPAITPAMPNKTVNASPANSAALTFVGAAGLSYINNLLFQRDAFTAAFTAPPVVAGSEGYQFDDNGIRFTVQTGGDFSNLSSATRIDAWYGFAAVRGIHAARIAQ